MSSNHHAAKASELVIANQIGGTYIDPNTDNYMAAQVEATLALAHEQRTANLLTLHAALRERRDNRQALELLTDIKERLFFA